MTGGRVELGIGAGGFWDAIEASGGRRLAPGQAVDALAEGIRKRCKATFGIGITGVAGPAGGTEEKPVGLVYIALASEDSTQVEERKFPGDRKRVRWFATQLALDMIRRKLM